MSLLEYNEIKERKYIIYENEPYEVLSSHVFRKQQRKPVNATKLKNLITGSVKEISFHVSEKVEEAEIDSKEIKYLYNNKSSLPADRQGEYWFSEPNDPSKRFSLKAEVVGPAGQFLKANTVVSILTFQGRHIGLKLPIKVELKVVEAPPAVKGDTAKGGTKQVKLETGAYINAPLFINEGEVIRINTETGEYVERA
ncbi:MAG: elongation factor P [Candidatus Taylorbacteria bacterium]|nr:elongation factor P [Candidatus Taylorbacteria bacterium]